MSIHAADALMGIFGFKRVAGDEITLDNPTSLDDDGGSLNEGMKMSEAKNEGLEVVAWRWKTPIPEELGGSFLWSHASHWSTGPKDAEKLCLLDEALAGYAVLRARIAELEGDLKCAHSMLGEVSKKGMELRAELAAAKETITRYETTAENCEVLRDALAAIKAQEPVTEVSEETFSSDGTSDVITHNLPIGTKLYDAPVAKQDNEDLKRAWQAGHDTAWYGKNPAHERGSVQVDKQVVMPELPYKHDPRSAQELGLAGCKCVRFGEGNPHWPCSVHDAPAISANPIGVAVPHELLVRVLEPVTSEQYLNSKHELCALMDAARLNAADQEGDQDE